MKKRVIVCTPAYGGNMQFEYVINLIRLDRLCEQRKIDIDYAFVANESLIQRARNYLCGQFLSQEQNTHLLFIDADIQFNAEDVVKMIEADVDLIGGVYPKKKLHWERFTKPDCMASMLDYVVTPLDEGKPIQDMYKPQPVKYVGTGLMLISRKVLETMQKENPDDWFYADGVKYYKFFDCVLKDSIYLSEDYYICDKWRQLGGTVYAAYWTRCVHWGTFGFDGNLFAMS